MDKATFEKEVAFIRRKYARSTMTLPGFVASGYEGIDDEAERLAALEHFIVGSEIRKDYWDAVNLIARRQLRRRNPLPAVLAHWVRDVLADQSFKGKAGKARPRPGLGLWEAVRDQMIRMAIENLVAREYTEMRSGGKGKLREACAEGGSACDVAGAAFGLTYKNTEGIWLSGKASRAS